MKKKVTLAVAGMVILVMVGVVFAHMTKTHEVGISPEEQQVNAEKAPVPLSEYVTTTIGESEGVTTASPVIPSTIPQKKEKLALLANGCFWCVEHDLEEVVGVIKVVSGYAGGNGDNPTYENYVGLGYKEVVLVTYDPSKISYGNLV